MAFKKTNDDSGRRKITRYDGKEIQDGEDMYNLSDPEDRNMIRDFEAELKRGVTEMPARPLEYYGTSVVGDKSKYKDIVFGENMVYNETIGIANTALVAWMERKGFIVKIGDVWNFTKHFSVYADKKTALNKLLGRREYAQKEEDKAFTSLVRDFT